MASHGDVLQVGVSRTVALGGCRVDAVGQDTITRDTGEEREWRAILTFDFQIATVRIAVGTEDERPDGEQVDAMLRTFADISADIGAFHGYDASDTKFSMN